ncbi:PREDICTED: putative glycine-rich cell wall structural protein 1, partial [Rhagoletis zephyria]|uniref:putative glycine-rich cell wall structural protein 1 n=1 Tax=Rhagoletis zephyria TaxID=28612 RepID=UPI0008117AE4
PPSLRHAQHELQTFTTSSSGGGGGGGDGGANSSGYDNGHSSAYALRRHSGTRGSIVGGGVRDGGTAKARIRETRLSPATLNRRELKMAMRNGAAAGVGVAGVGGLGGPPPAPSTGMGTANLLR